MIDKKKILNLGDPSKETKETNSILYRKIDNKLLPIIISSAILLITVAIDVTIREYLKK